MPLYEYKCEKCGHRFEKIESLSASPTKKCPVCGAKAERMLAPPAIQFKGSGWYVSDYGKSSRAKSDKPEEKPADKPPASSTDGDASGKKGSAAKESARKGKKD